MILLIVLLAAIGVVGCVGWLQQRLIFFPDALDDHKDLSWTGAAEEVFLKADDGARIHGLYFQAPTPPRGVVLYLHGNAGSVASWSPVALDLTAYGVDVLLLDYRTYGKSRGEMSEQGLYLDAEAAYAHLLARGVEPSAIVVHGRSLGSAVASHLAANHEVGGLILETPFTSLQALAGELYPFFIPRFLLRYKMDTLGRVAAIAAPTWVVHGTADQVVPVDHSRQLLEASAGTWELTIIDGGGHNDLMSSARYHRDLQRFYQLVFPAPGVEGGPP